MIDCAQLWLPIVASSVLVFVASSLIHMVFKWHNSDYRKLANEDEVMAAIRAGSPTPGQYVMPHCIDMKAMGDDSMQKKFRDGPVGLLTLKKNGPPSMGAALILWFLLVLVIATVAACLALQTYGLNDGSRRPGHLIGMISLLAYACGAVQAGIWMGKPWGSVAKDLLDAVIYATVSALTFMWLWP